MKTQFENIFLEIYCFIKENDLLEQKSFYEITQKKFEVYVGARKKGYSI